MNTVDWFDLHELKIQGALYELQEYVHSIAKSKGWYDQERTFPELIALMHSELSEALEAYRKDPDVTHIYRGNYPDASKPEGVASELADVIIRILDAAESMSIPLVREMFEKLKYNETRPYRHGGKSV